MTKYSVQLKNVLDVSIYVEAEDSAQAVDMAIAQVEAAFEAWQPGFKAKVYPFRNYRRRVELVTWETDEA